MSPKFIVYCGPMFSAKTTSLFLTLEKFELQGKVVRLFKPKIDDRYSTSEIVTHSGWKRKATLITKEIDILRDLELNPAHVVALDEAFMIKGCSKVLSWLFKNGITIVVSSLDLSFNGKSFKEIEKILSWATDVQKCTAVCTVCGADARYTYRKSDDNDDIIIGGKELYEPRCFDHHPIINERVQSNLKKEKD